jgi:hypothetical protein
MTTGAYCDEGMNVKKLDIVQKFRMPYSSKCSVAEKRISFGWMAGRLGCGSVCPSIACYPADWLRKTNSSKITVH